MIDRNLKLPKQHSFFLFGPRQTGKSTLLKSLFPSEMRLYYDLLQTKEYHRLSENPSLFREEVMSRDKNITHVIVDEIQRIPDLLNEIHSLMEETNSPHFIMTGSSARKLKRSHANLLAGRAWTYQLTPLTFRELKGKFRLERALQFGTLPSVYLAEDHAAHETLKAYVDTYLREEIEMEALIRNLGVFLRFLGLAAEANGEVVNYSALARETGTSYKTIQEYFKILEDTLIGFVLPPYVRSIRRRLIKHPKFYFFDTGVHRQLMRRSVLPVEPRTSEFGRAFEHFMILEIMRLTRYAGKEYEFFFYRSAAHAEVDLIVETPERSVYAIEIKAAENPSAADLSGLQSFGEVCPKARLLCASLAPRKRIVNSIEILPWQNIFEILDI